MVSMFLPQISQLSSQWYIPMAVVWNLSIFLDTLYSICFYLCPDSYSVPDTQSVWQAAELPLSYWGYHCNLRLTSQAATCRTPKCAVKAYVCVCACVHAWAEASLSWIERNVITLVPLSPMACQAQHAWSHKHVQTAQWM